MTGTDNDGRLNIGTVEDILAAEDIDEDVVEIPEWRCAVKVKGFSKKAQKELRKQATDATGELDTDRLEGLMFIHGVVEPAFTAENYDALMEKSAGAVDKVLEKILEVSGLKPGFRKSPTDQVRG